MTPEIVVPVLAAPGDIHILLGMFPKHELRIFYLDALGNDVACAFSLLHNSSLLSVLMGFLPVLILVLLQPQHRPLGKL